MMQTPDRRGRKQVSLRHDDFHVRSSATTLFIINAHFDNSNGLVSIVIATKQADLIRIQFQTQID